MKTINKILSFAVVMLLGISATSCTDGNDWGFDSAYDRLFGVGEDDISVETTATTATVTFSAMSASKDSLYFIIEVSKDSLYDEVAMGGPGAMVFGQNKEIKKSPVVLTGLDGDTKYYMRIKTMSDTKQESKWVYYKDGESFKTKAEQIFNELSLSDISDSSIRLSWAAGSEVTDIAQISSRTDGTKDTLKIALDETAKANAEYLVTGLTASTTYTFVIYNGDIKRGTISATTSAAMPDGDFKTTLSESITVLDQTVLDEIVSTAKSETGKENVGITIGIPANKVIDVCTVEENPSSGDGIASLVIPDGVSVTFFGLPGEKTTLNFKKSLEIGGSHSYIRFENVNIADGGCQYLVNQKNACSIGDISFKTVNINTLSRSLVRLQGDGADLRKTINNINIDDCVIENQGDGGYAMLLFKDASETVENISIKNSTFNGIFNTFIQNAGSNGMKEISIEQCTFYNVIGSSKYLIDANKLTGTIKVSKCIFAKTNSEDKSKGIRTAGTLSIDQVYFTSDFVLSSDKFTADLPFDQVASDKLFKNAAEGDFTVLNSDISIYGDQRWNVAE